MNEVFFHSKMLAFETVFMVAACIGFVWEKSRAPGVAWYERAIYSPIEFWLDGESNEHQCHLYT